MSRNCKHREQLQVNYGTCNLRSLQQNHMHVLLSSTGNLPCCRGADKESTTAGINNISWSRSTHRHRTVIYWAPAYWCILKVRMHTAVRVQHDLMVDVKPQVPQYEGCHTRQVPICTACKHTRWQQVVEGLYDTNPCLSHRLEVAPSMTAFCRYVGCKAAQHAVACCCC